MKRVAVAATCAGLLAVGVILNAQAPAPFKLGTFQLQNRTFIGIVVRDTQVIDFAAADSVIGRGRDAAPADMKQLIERYDAGVRERIYAVVKSVTSAQGARPNYVHELSSLKTLPPIAGSAASRWRASAGNSAARDEERAWNLGTENGRHALESICLPEGAVGDRRRR